MRRGVQQLARVRVAFNGIYGRVSAVIHNTPPAGTPDPVLPQHEPVAPERQPIEPVREQTNAEGEHNEPEPDVTQGGPDDDAEALVNIANDDAASVQSDDSAETAAEELPAVEDEEDEDDDDANTAAEPEAAEGAAMDDEEEAYIPRAQPRQPLQPNHNPIIHRPLPQAWNPNDPWHDLYTQGVRHLRRAAVQVDNLDYVRITRTPEGGMALQGGRPEARQAREALRSAEADIHDAYTHVLLGIQNGRNEFVRLQGNMQALDVEIDRVMLQHHQLRLNYEAIRAHNGALSLRIEHLEEERNRMMGFDEDE